MAITPEDTLRRVIDHPTTHLRVLGPPGSGKTRLLVERFRALEARHGGGVFILTYSSENHKRLTDAVFEKNTGRTGPSRVLTYSRLAVEVIESSGTRPPLIVTDLEEHLLLGEVIAVHEIFLKSDLRSICRSERFRHDLRDVCHLLLQNDVVGPRLRALRDAASGAELSDVLVLYDGFREALDARGAATYYDIAWKALESGGIGGRNGRGDRGLRGRGKGEDVGEGESVRGHPLAGARAILIEDFQDIDPGQFALLTALAPPDGDVKLNVFGDPMGSVFAHRGTQHRFLMEDFPRLYGDVTFHLPARRPERGVPGETIEALLEETVREGARDYLPVVTGPAREGPRGDASRGFLVEVVRDEMEEVYVVAARVAELLRGDIRKPDEIAIVTNEKQRYEPLLAAAATQRGIPLDTGRAGRTVFSDFADAFMTLVDSPDHPIAARSVTTSPLYPFVERPSAEREARVADDDRPAEEDLRAIVAEIQRATASCDPRRWMEIIVDRCLRAACDAQTGASDDDAARRDVCRLLEAWDRYVTAVERWGGRPDVGAFAALDASLPRARPAVRPGAVSFLSCREAKGRFFPAVFVIGCSELLFPSAGRRENVLPMAALEAALRRACAEPVEVYRARNAQRRLEEEYHLLAIALTRATGSLHVTAPEAFAGEDYPAPSALLGRSVPEELRVRLESAKRVPPQIRFAMAWATGAPARGDGEARVESEARDVETREIEAREVEAREIEAREVEAREIEAREVEARLDRLSPAGFLWRSRRPEAGLVRLTPFPLSQSTINTFLACHRRFFYRKTLRLPEADSPPMRVGSLFHAVMAALGERFPTKAALVAGATLEVIRDVVADVVRGDEEIAKTPFYERLFRHHLQKMAEKILALERTDPENYTVRAIEETITYPCGPWEFTGRIDRVHETPAGKTVIVDYKTGKTDKKAATLQKKTLAALEDPKKANWQVPIYAWGLKTVEGRSPRAFTLMATSPREEPFAVTLAIRRDEADPPPRDEKGRVLPHLLESQIESVMAKAVGVAEAIFAPRSRFERTDDHNACRYCDFKRLCRREER